MSIPATRISHSVHHACLALAPLSWSSSENELDVVDGECGVDHEAAIAAEASPRADDRWIGPVNASVGRENMLLGGYARLWHGAVTCVFGRMSPLSQHQLR